MNLKRSLIFVSLLGIPLPVVAGDINQLQILNQDEFHRLSQDLGAALSYKPLTPTAPLGITGFDLGLAVTSTSIKNSDVLQKAGAGDHSSLPVPSLRLNKGLPFGIDVGVRLFGGELRYAIVSGGAVMPAIGVRGSYTKLSGVDQLEFNTRGLDLSISKGFLMFTPYAGIGRVWTTSTPMGTAAAAGLSKESPSLNKVFVGLNLNFGLMNLALEGDKTGDAQSYGAKLGFRF